MLLVFVLLLLDTVAVTEQEVHADRRYHKGDLREGAGLQRWESGKPARCWLGALQVPELAVALIERHFADWKPVPFTAIFVAGSGPSLVTVKVAVTCCRRSPLRAGRRTGATQVMHKSVAVPSSTTNALLGSVERALQRILGLQVPWPLSYGGGVANKISIQAGIDRDAGAAIHAIATKVSDKRTNLILAHDCGRINLGKESVRRAVQHALDRRNW